MHQDYIWNLFNCKHPVIKQRIKDPQTGKTFKFTLTGGRNDTQIKEADTVVYLDSIHFIMDNHAKLGNTQQHIIYFPIRDGETPENKNEFEKLIKTLGYELYQGKHIHITCIGGHGRTGTVLACLLGKYLQIGDPVKYIRENYCKEAVETFKQHKYVRQFTGKGERPNPEDYRKDSYSLWFTDRDNPKSIGKIYEHKEGKTTVLDENGNFLYEFEQSTDLFYRVHGKEENKKTSDDERLDEWYIKRYGFNREDFLTKMRAPDAMQKEIADSLTEEFKREQKRVNGYYEPNGIGNV